MATSLMFPWRHCALAGSQYKKCIGMQSRNDSDTTFAQEHVVPAVYIMLPVHVSVHT